MKIKKKQYLIIELLEEVKIATSNVEVENDKLKIAQHIPHTNTCMY